MVGISGRELRVYRDTLLAFMGHILVSQYGEEALDVLVKWRYEKIREHWRRIAEETERQDPEIFLSLFSKEAHDYEVIRRSKKALEVVVKKCIHAEVFKKYNAQHIGLKLICSGDEAVAEGYNPKIKFRRPKILMRGDDCCHFIWELEEE